MRRSKAISYSLGISVAAAFYVTVNIWMKEFFLPIYGQFQGNLIADTAVLGAAIGHILGTYYSGKSAFYIMELKFRDKAGDTGE